LKRFSKIYFQKVFFKTYFYLKGIFEILENGGTGQK